MINIAAAETENNLKPKLSILGVGGAGCNAINNMINSNLEGIDLLVANTDAQDLSTSKAQRKIQLGISLTKGLGAGANPEIGRAAAEESINEVIESLSDSNMVFVTAGLGGGTGSGATGVICRALKEKGILTVGVVTKPFNFEGKQRGKVAEMAIHDIKDAVDTLIIIPNQNLFNVIDKSTSLEDAFNLTDEVLHDGIRSITDLITKQGRMNKDFADVKSIVSKMGEAMMGTGQAEGEDRAIKAAEQAIANPLLDNVSMKGARGVLLNIIGSNDITLFEVDEITNRIRDEIDSEDEAEFIIGTTIDESMGNMLKVSIVATGLTENGEMPVKKTVKQPKINRPFMDDEAQDITEISFDKEHKEEIVAEDSAEVEETTEENEDIVIPVSLFSSGLEEEKEEEEEIRIPGQPLNEAIATQEAPLAQPQEVESEVSRESIIKISEDGEVIRPEVEADKEIVSNIGVKEVSHDKENFFNRIMKSKEKKESIDSEITEEKQESFEDMELPGFLQKK